MTTHAILATEVLEAMSLVGTKAVSSDTPENRYWEAVVSRDSKHDGEFFFAVSTTGVYCRPSCAARRPRRENVQFFRTPEAAEQAGYVLVCAAVRGRSPAIPNPIS
jgi:hypothetical protein